MEVPNNDEIIIIMIRELYRFLVLSVVSRPQEQQQQQQQHRRHILALTAMKEKWVRKLAQSENAKSFAAALFYGFCSISLNFLNKAVVSSYDFNFPFFIMVCQMVTTVLVLDVLRLAGFLPGLSPYSWEEGKSFMAASLCFALHATLSLSALRGMNIPMYGAIKRCTPLLNLALSVVILKKNFPSK